MFEAYKQGSFDKFRNTSKTERPRTKLINTNEGPKDYECKPALVSTGLTR